MGAKLWEAEIKDHGRAKKPPEVRAKLLKIYLNLLFFYFFHFFMVVMKERWGWKIGN